MRWVYLAVAILGFASLWGVGPQIALPIAFAVMFANFATFCILYERPRERARQRVADQLRRMNPNSDVAQRLSTAAISTTESDRKLGFGPMTIANLATGVAGLGLLVWGVVLRAM